ncbi:MAG: ABC transporter ATP-binding protein [Clostridia bacterium]|nr:ABC transporter ATP-binding protein [Clostridia bacterium]
MMQEKKKFSFFGIPKIARFLKKYRKEMLLMVLFGLSGSLVDIILPLFQKHALDNFVRGNTTDGIIVFAAMYVFSVVFAAVVNYFACCLAMTIEVSINRDLRQSAFNHLQTLSFSYFNQNSVGYIHARVMSDTSRVGELVSWTLIDSVWRISYLAGSIGVMFYLNARLTLLVLLILPLLVVLFTVFQRKILRVNREIREINSNITGNFNEAIMGAKTIKSLAVEDELYSGFVKNTSEYKKKSVMSSHLRGLFAGTMNLASSIALAIVLWQGGYIAESDVGTFSAFMSYAQGMMEPVRWLVDIISDLITTEANIERFSALLSVKSDVVDTPEVIEKYGDSFEPKRENWEPIKGDVEFKDVTFKYPDGDEYVLEDFSLKVPFGSHVAIVGETGAGKSTLVNLVCRFYEPTVGKVLIDGKDARERSQLWLHSSIGYVLQTPHLFSGTIRENILMGKPDATDEEITAAIKAVSADEIIAKLDDGLDTDVGEGGDLLSTGEKQLISFARAVISDPKILILDEATASVDTITEAKIQAAMEKVTEGRTSIMIAHRLSTVKNADVILVVKNGKIVERGTHSELIKSRGYYYELYTRQYQDEKTAKILS